MSSCKCFLVNQNWLTNYHLSKVGLLFIFSKNFQPFWKYEKWSYLLVIGCRHFPPQN